MEYKVNIFISKKGESPTAGDRDTLSSVDFDNPEELCEAVSQRALELVTEYIEQEESKDD